MRWCVDWIRLLWGVIPSAAWGGGEATARGDSVFFGRKSLAQLVSKDRSVKLKWEVSFCWVWRLTTTEDECILKTKVSLRQQINPVFLFWTLHCAPVERAVAQQVWHAYCIWVFTSAEKKKLPSQHRVSRVSLLETAESLTHVFFWPINMCDHQSGTDPMIRLEKYLCIIYCVSVWFHPRAQSHTAFVDIEEEQRKH